MAAKKTSSTSSGSSSSSKTSSATAQATKSNSKTSSTTKNKSTTKDKSKSLTTSSGSSSTTSSSITAAVGDVDANTQAKYDKYNSSEYQQSQAVTDAYNRLQQTLNNKPGAFSSGYKDQLDSIYNQIANREKFSYDFNKDAMYQLYKDRYIEQGKQAMQDTMGQAAQLTGGYGSSYSQTAGQQAYQNYLEALNDQIPTLRNQALQEYESEGNRLNNQFALANQMYGNDWQQYRATVGDYQNDRGFYQGAYSDERNFDYGKYSSDRDYTANQYWNMRNAVKATTGTSNTNTTNTSTTNTSGTSTTNSSSNTLSNTLSNSLMNSLTNSSTNSSSSSGSTTYHYDDGSSGSMDYTKYLTNANLTNALAEIARTAKGSSKNTEQLKLIKNAVSNHQITQTQADAYAMYWGL